MQQAANLAPGKLRPEHSRDETIFTCASRQKEPFDILYFTPAVTTIMNLNDRSFSFVPELLYTGITNLELRLKTFFLVGKGGSELRGKGQ